MKAVQAYDPPTRLKLKSKDAIIHFDEGLIGFSEFKDYVLMENESLAPFRLLQSLEAPEVGFLVLRIFIHHLNTAAGPTADLYLILQP